MKTIDFIGCCIGCCILDCNKVDELCYDFDEDIDENDINDMIDCKGGTNFLISLIFNKVIDKFDKYENDFDYYINSLDSHLYLFGEEVYDITDIKNLIDEKRMQEVA